MPKWTPSPNYKKSITIPAVIIVFIIVFWVLTLFSLLGSNNSTFINLNFIFLTIFGVYMTGRLYGEVQSNNDFINITSEGINYRETPTFQMGWLPSTKSIAFSEIRSVDMVSIKKMFNPEEESYGIMVHMQQGKSKLIGTRLEQKQLMEVAFALKGSVMLTGSLKRLLGEDVTLKDVVDTAKGFWNSLKQKREDLNRRYTEENDD